MTYGLLADPAEVSLQVLYYRVLHVEVNPF